MKRVREVKDLSADAAARGRRDPGRGARVDQGGGRVLLQPRLRVRVAHQRRARVDAATASRCRSCSSSATASASWARCRSTARRHAQGGAGGGGEQGAASACASTWIRTASCRRAPGAASRKPPEGDEIVGVARMIKPDDVVCVVTSGARALVCKADELPELAGPGRGVTVIKLGRRRRWSAFGVGRAKDKDVVIAETDERQGAADRARALQGRRRAAARATRCQAQDRDRARELVGAAGHDARAA